MNTVGPRCGDNPALRTAFESNSPHLYFRAWAAERRPWAPRGVRFDRSPSPNDDPADWRRGFASNSNRRASTSFTKTPASLEKRWCARVQANAPEDSNSNRAVATTDNGVNAACLKSRDFEEAAGALDAEPARAVAHCLAHVVHAEKRAKLLSANRASSRCRARRRSRVQQNSLG